MDSSDQNKLGRLYLMPINACNITGDVNNSYHSFYHTDSQVVTPPSINALFYTSHTACGSDNLFDFFLFYIVCQILNIITHRYTFS